MNSVVADHLMPRRPTPRGTLPPAIAVWIGSLVTLLVVAPATLRTLNEPGWRSAGHLAGWYAAVAIFWAADRFACRATRSRVALGWLSIATFAALFAIASLPVLYPGIAVTAALLSVTAGRTHRFPNGVAAVWIAAQSGFLAWVFVERFQVGAGLTATFAFVAFQVLVYSCLRIAGSERAVRAELASAARRLERGQIAAELHDVLGHHLVALRLQLEAARASADDRHLEQARELTRLLIAEVRNVVDEMQAAEDFDLVSSLNALADSATTPRVEVEIDGVPGGLDPEASRAWFRVTQEAVTNARKHAGATRIVVRVRDGAIDIVDDGTSWSGPLTGRGLSGMQARGQAAHACVSFDRRPGNGTTVKIEADRPVEQGGVP